MTIEAAFAEHQRVLQEAAELLPPILQRVADALYDALEAGRKLLACGNGGSASDAEHLVAELIGRYRDERRALAAMSLGGGMATMTALANDYGYETVFARQVEAIAQPGDLLFAISTSGNSPNVLAAATAARARGVTVVGFTGLSGGKLAAVVDHLVAVPSQVTARIQEIHILCMHTICERLDARLLLEGPHKI